MTRVPQSSHNLHTLWRFGALIGRYIPSMEPFDRLVRLLLVQSRKRQTVNSDDGVATCVVHFPQAVFILPFIVAVRHAL